MRLFNSAYICTSIIEVFFFKEFKSTSSKRIYQEYSRVNHVSALMHVCDGIFKIRVQRMRFSLRNSVRTEWVRGKIFSPNERTLPSSWRNLKAIFLGRNNKKRRGKINVTGKKLVVATTAMKVDFFRVSFVSEEYSLFFDSRFQSRDQDHCALAFHWTMNERREFIRF